MPTHAVFSCVTPAYYMHGSATGQYSFTSWLGNNSKQGKMTRLLREIQGHMRLRISGDRNEVRQSYMQTVFDRLVRRFAHDGADAVDEIINLMDEYYLTKEDFDSIIEISIGPNNGEALMKGVTPNAKAAFTRKYVLILNYADIGTMPDHIRWRFKRRVQSLSLKAGRGIDLMSRMHLRIVMKAKQSKKRWMKRRTKILAKTK
jgi:Replication factor RFC1 C terminal domain